MASLLRSRVNGCTRRMILSLQSSSTRVCNGNGIRCVQRRFASNQPPGSSASLTLPLLGTASLGLVLYLVYDAWTYDPVPNVHPRGKKSGKTAHPEAVAEILATGEGSNVSSGNTTPPEEKAPEQVAEATDAAPRKTPVTSTAPVGNTLPEHVPYVLIGAGTASFACMKAIQEKDPNGKILIIGEEDYTPYMRPPLSKPLWLEENHDDARQLKFPASWAGGKLIDVFYKYPFVKPYELSQQEGGAAAVLTGNQVTSINSSDKKIVLSDGSTIKYDKCLIATGGKPKTLPVFSQGSEQLKQKVSVYRNINDFLQLDDVVMKAKSVLIVGGGFLGSELAVGIANRGKPNNLQITQVFPEVGNLGLVLPKELSKWTTEKVRKEGVTVIPGAGVSSAEVGDDNKVSVKLTNGDQVNVDHVVVAVGLNADTRLATSSSGLEVDTEVGGYRVNSELQACSDIWVAGDVSSFYDPYLGRRRVEHHDHANVTGRLAGENMTGAQKQYTHQSMFWSDVGPDVGFEAVGLIDAKLETVGVWAKTKEDPPTAEGAKETKPEDDYSRGVVFYLKEKRIVGVLTWNCFGKMDLARQMIASEATKADINKHIKDFDVHT